MVNRRFTYATPGGAGNVPVPFPAMLAVLALIVLGTPAAAQDSNVTVDWSVLDGPVATMPPDFMAGRAIMPRPEPRRPAREAAPARTMPAPSAPEPVDDAEEAFAELVERIERTAPLNEAQRAALFARWQAERGRTGRTGANDPAASSALGRPMPLTQPVESEPLDDPRRARLPVPQPGNVAFPDTGALVGRAPMLSPSDTLAPLPGSTSAPRIVLTPPGGTDADAGENRLRLRPPGSASATAEARPPVPPSEPSARLATPPPEPVRLSRVEPQPRGQEPPAPAAPARRPPPQQDLTAPEPRAAEPVERPRLDPDRLPPQAEPPAASPPQPAPAATPPAEVATARPANPPAGRPAPMPEDPPAPAPTQMAALPRTPPPMDPTPPAADPPAAAPEPVSVNRRDVRLIFSPEGTDLNAQARATLDALAERLDAAPDLRLSLRAFASGNAAKARRTSLTRALEVRAYLMDRGIAANRIDVSAQGNDTPVEPVDRVDMIVGS